MAIVFFHSHVTSIGVPAYDAFLAFFHHYGTLGVDLFFIISGYCIHGAYANAGDKFVAKNYLQRRWWRIYPPYFFALGLAVLLNLMTNWAKWQTGQGITWNNFGAAQILSHVFLVHNFSQQTMLTISGPFWTIAMEMQYYLIYLLVRPLFYSRRGWAAVFIAAFALYYAAWRVYYSGWTLQPLNPFCYWIEWLAGAFLVYVVKNQYWDRRFKYWQVVLLCVLFYFVTAAARYGVNYYVFNILYLAAFSFMILVFINMEKIWSWTGFRWLPRIGLFSYSVYLVHFLFMDRIRVFVIMNLPAGWLRMSVSLLAIGICLGASYLFFQYCERPFLEKAASIKKS